MQNPVSGMDLTPCNSRVEADWLESSFAEKDFRGPGGTRYWHALAVTKTDRTQVYINKYVASRSTQSPSVQFLQHCVWSIVSGGIPGTRETLMCWRECSGRPTDGYEGGACGA